MRKPLLGWLTAAAAALFLSAVAVAQLAPVPALPDSPRVTSYTASGSTGPYQVGFAVYGDSSDYTAWLLVTLDGVTQTGNWTLDSPSGALASLPRPITDARITFTAPVTGNLVITGARRPRRTAQNDEGRGVTARDWNRQLTDIIAMLRENWDARSRQLLVPPGETAALLPPASARALQMLGFDNTGAPIAAQPSSALVSSAMQDVVAASSHANALTLLGAAPATATIPVCAEIDYAALAVPALWLPEDGTTRLRAGFPELLACLAPTLTATVTLGSTTVTVPSTAGFNTGWPVECTCIAAGTTIAAIADGTHITLSAPATGNGSAVQVFPYGNGDGVNSFTLPNSVGVVYAGLDLSQTNLTNGHKLNAALGAQSRMMLRTDLPNYALIIPAGQGSHFHGLQHNETIGDGGGPPNTGWKDGTGATDNTNASTLPQMGTESMNGNVTQTAQSTVQPTQIRRKIIYAGR